MMTKVRELLTRLSPRRAFEATVERAVSRALFEHPPAPSTSINVHISGHIVGADAAGKVARAVRRALRTS